MSDHDMTHTDFDQADVVRTCTRKKGYPSEDVAKLAIVSIRKTSPNASVRVYACRRCGMWHVGGAPRDAHFVVVESELDSDLEDSRDRRKRGGRTMRRVSYGDGYTRRPKRRD